MSILSSILHKILGPKAASAGSPATTQQQQAQSQGAGPQMQGSAPQAQGAPAQSTQFQGSTPGASQRQDVDITQVLTDMESKSGQNLNWRESIVDLMKLLGLDSSLTARKELAEELGYTGERNGSAEMNLWLHREVMKRVAQNGGKVPPELLVH